MSSMAALLTQIKQIIIDLKSDKVTVRSKGLDEFQNIFDNRSKELSALLRSNNNCGDDDDPFSWSNLFEEVHAAVKDQCYRIESSNRLQNQKGLISKNDSYKGALRKCINAANEQMPNVSYTNICTAALECFETPCMRNHFDAVYLQIVFKHILNAKHCLNELKIDEWSRLLSHIFHLYKSEQTQISKLELLQCVPLVLRHGLKYRYLVNDLHQYLPYIIQIVNEGQLQNQINSQKQILFIVYAFICSLAVNQRLSLVGFNEQVLDKLLKLYQFSMDADSKTNLFKIIHISIIVHSPERISGQYGSTVNGTSQPVDDLFKQNVAEDLQLWYKHLRNMLSIVEREIIESRKRSLRSNVTPIICPIFVRMAAKLCSVVYWNDEIWSGGSDEQQQKRRRHSMKLERIFELIQYEPSKFCWRWFAITSQLMVDFPHLLDAEDYQPLLKLLKDFKPLIQYSLQMKYFICMVEVMLSKEPQLKANSTQIRESFCTEHWHQIMELSFKQAATDKMQLENLDLMRVLIENKVAHDSHDFIKGVIKEITKMVHIRKSNNAISLLISILRNVSTDMIEGIQDLKVTVINWLSSKYKLSELKNVIQNNGSFDQQLVSELYVLCVLSRQGNSYNKSWHSHAIDVQEDADVREHILLIENVVENLQYRMLSKLIVSDVKPIHEHHDLEPIEKLPAKNEVKAIVNERTFVELDKTISDDSSLNENSTENFNNIAASLATSVNVLNALVGYESFDCDNFQAFLQKRIFFKINQLNLMVNNFSSSLNIDRNPNDVNEIVDNLMNIWNDNYHPIIAANLFIVEKSASIIVWIKKQLRPFKGEASMILSPLQTINQLSFEERIQLKCLTLLAYFSAHEDDQDDNNDIDVDADDRSLRVFEAIEKSNFNYKRNEDLFIDMQLIKIILNQNDASEKQIDWAFTEIKYFWQNLSKHSDYMELTVGFFPALIKRVKPYEEMHEDLKKLLLAFSKRLKSKYYGPSVCLKVIKSFQYYAQEFFRDEVCFAIITFMKYFLNSEYLSIQFAAVSCLTNIFNKQWLNFDEDTVKCVEIQNFHKTLIEQLEINELCVNPEYDVDRKTCIVATRLQFYCSIIGVCYPLRKQTWFDLIEFCGEQLKLNEGKTTEIIEKLCTNVFNLKPFELLADLFSELIAMWIDNNYHLTRFPAKLTQCDNHNDFLIKYMDAITLRILLYRTEFLPELLQMTESDSLTNILNTSIVVKCLARLTSIQVIPTENKTQAANIVKILMKEKLQIDRYFDLHSLEIIEELLINMWDEEKFRECFDTDVEFVTDKHTIDYASFMKSVDYVQQKAKKAFNIIHYYCEMSPRKIVNILFSLKLLLQNASCEELKMCQMLRVCVLIDIVADFLIENVAKPSQSSVVGFFVRDFVYLFGNLISSNYSDKFKLATCKYFRKLCAKILPKCSEHFQCHLNYIVSVLMPITKNKTQTKLVGEGMALLRFLIVDNTDVLRMAIGQLDSFPKQHEFDELSRIQSDVKYNGAAFTLLDEIEYFLAVDKRKVEGLLSLKTYLSKNKNELQDIYKTIYDSRGFSEDCERSPIHRLISALLTQIVQNVDSRKSLIAAKCLAELGPSDLGSITLKFDVQPQTYKICKGFEDAVSNLCEHALDKLNGIFKHSDATVLQAAADACRYLLESQAAAAFLEQYPLLKVFETGATNQLPLKQKYEAHNFKNLFNDAAFKSKHSFWVKSLAIDLFTHFDSAPLAEIAAKQIQFSTAMVPLLIKTLLTTKNATNHQTLNEAVNLFFSKTFGKLNAEDEAELMESNTPVYLDKMSIKLMLKVAECIRMHNQAVPQERLNLNYLYIAKAALFCEAYFTAILYGELAFYGDVDDMVKTEIRTIMKSAYQSIGETDAVSAFLDPIKQKMEYLELNRCWNEILIDMDVKANALPQYSSYLNEAGLYGLANKLSQGVAPNFECAWRLADWSIVEGTESLPNQTGDVSLEFDKYHYFALKNLQQKDQIGAKINVTKAFESAIKRFKQSSNECPKNIYKNLMMLHLIQQIEDFCDVQFVNNDEATIKQLISKWKHQDGIASSGFNYREPILAQRVVLFESAGIRVKRKLDNVCKFTDGVEQMILNLVAECREEGFLNKGERYSLMFHKRKLSVEIEHEMRARGFIEDAQLNWSRGESEMAQHLINHVIKEQRPSFTHPKALRMMGEYLAEARLEDTNTIVKSYFMRSMKFSTNLRSKDLTGKAYNLPAEERMHLDLENRQRNYQAMAKYADREYQQIAAYKKSSEFEKKQASIKRNNDILLDMQRRSHNLTSDEKKSYNVLQKSVSIDQSDVDSTNTEYQQYLHLAVESYIQTILLEGATELNSLSMFRLFSLWLSNMSNNEVLKEIEENYTRIPMYKFISLMPQITTQLSSDGIKRVIEDIILKCACLHPHHVLPKVLALVNAFRDDDFIKGTKKLPTNSPRTDAATKLLQKLKTYGQLRDCIIQMERMFEVLIRLANEKLENTKEFAANEPLRHLRDLDLVHCPTVHLPISISGDYSKTMVSIVKWKSTFSNCNGINAPKRIECIGSNGKQYSQLLKGNDDLRQDAVMQQVFNIMNDMLGQSKITKKDRLHVRTYVIVPLSQRSGILEWCENTMPLTDYLVGTSKRKGAHERFRPQDWTPKDCRKKLEQTPWRKSPFENHKNYMDICDHIKPVFHHFFFEHFHNPGVWFERRMAYAHSLATTSMIGYILGIGDRHVNNILIDKTTAELIHIDFGIAFEQGKCLPTPELIPFRLTRDFVSALGPSGVEGVYRKSCEKTMEVLRQNKSIILTIVEVLMHDPLYAWALTSNQASKRQQTTIQIDEDQDKNSMAERALWRLEEKLDGKHVSRSEGISVKRHVEILIKEATNDKLLCKLFVGWQPYL